MHAIASQVPTRADVAGLWKLLWGLAGAAAVCGWLIFSYGYIEDDAYIHLEFARSLIEGRGFSFNGALVNGDTAPLWVIALAAVHSLGFGWIDGAKVLCAIGVLSALSGVWRVAGDLSGGGPRHRYLAYVAVTVTALNPYFVHWSFSGMESAAALGISLWAIWAVFSPAPPTSRRLCVAAALLAVAPLLRPELLMLSGLAGIALLYRVGRMPATPGYRWPAIVSLALIMALPTILWMLYALESFGSIVPNTNAAKRGGEFVAVTLRLASVYAVGFAGTIALLPLTIKRLLKPGVPAMVWALLIWPACCVVFYIADHTAVQTRYCLLSMPSLTIAALWLAGESLRPAWVRGAVAAMLVMAVGVVAAIVYPQVSNKLKLVKTLSITAAYIRRNVPAAAPIAVYAIGQLSFESRHPLIDIGGITRPGVVPYLNDLPATIRWAKEQGALYYIGGESPEPTAVRVFSYPMPFLAWSFRGADYDTATEAGIYRFQ